MEKRLFAAAALSVVILLVWAWLFPPPPPPAEPAPGPADTAPAETLPAQEKAAPEVEAPETVAATPGEAIRGQAEQRIEVDNDLFEVALTNVGASAISWKLRDYADSDGHPVALFRPFVEEHDFPLTVELDDPELTATLNGALYRVERESVARQDALAAGTRVTFTWSDGAGLRARKALTFRDASYLVDVELEVTDRGRRVPARLTIGPGFGARARGSTYYYESQGVWNSAGHVTRLKKGKLTGEPGRLAGPIRWAGLEDQYFAMLVLPRSTETQFGWRSVELTPAAGENGEAREADAQPVLSVSIPREGASLFVGPKRYRMLRDLGGDLEKVVWFSSIAFLAWISKGIFLALLWIHDHTVHNYGLAIIGATFVLRLVLFPVNQFAMVSMKKTQLQMQRLQPKMNAIKNKYRKSKDSESRAKMNQEMMELYRREGVNPMGGVSGCLPLVAQFPILIGFYNMLTVAIELRGAHFFAWIQDLSQKDPLYVVPLLMGATMFLQQRMSMGKVKDPMQQQQQKIMMIMPFVFTWICIQMPSGMVLYWFVNNLLGIGQQWLVNRQTSRLEAAAQKA